MRFKNLKKAKNKNGFSLDVTICDFHLSNSSKLNWNQASLKISVFKSCLYYFITELFIQCKSEIAAQPIFNDSDKC